MSNLANQPINSSFPGLLQIPGGITSSLQTVQDGNGNSTGLQISSTGVNAITASNFTATHNGAAITGAVARPISDGFGDYLSVKDFGAIGDNTNDDTTAIQAAINYGISSGTAVIYFPVGIYKITSTLNVSAGLISLKGQASGWFGGGGSTIRMATANTTIIHIYGASAAAQINSNEVTDLLLVHGETSIDDTNTAGSGILVENAVRTLIDNVVIIGMNSGIKFNFVIDATVTRTKIHRVFNVPAGTAYGILLVDDGTHFNASNTFRDMIISGSPTRIGSFIGISYNGSGLNDQFFENTEISLCEIGIQFGLSSPVVQYDIKIHKCVIDNYKTYAIDLYGFTNAGGVDIIGGWCAPASGLSGTVAAIHIVSCAGIKVLGIEMVGISNVTNTSSYGILANNSTDCQIIGNRIRDFYSNIGADTLVNTVISDNSIKNTTATAPQYLCILNTNSTKNTVVGNVFDAGTASGVGLYFGSGSINNAVSGNTYPGTFTVVSVQDVNSGASANKNTIISYGTTTGAAAATGTLTNAPIAGNPTYWHPIIIEGTRYYFPCWAA